MREDLFSTERISVQRVSFRPSVQQVNAAVH